jgi:transcriptional regulator with XRE-family HTH domain
MKIGSIVKKIRKSKNLKQKELALLADVPVTVLSMIENDKREAGTGHLKRISEALRVPLPILVFKTLDEDLISEDKKQSFRELSQIVEEEFLKNS